MTAHGTTAGHQFSDHPSTTATSCARGWSRQTPGSRGSIVHTTWTPSHDASSCGDRHAETVAISSGGDEAHVATLAQHHQRPAWMRGVDQMVSQAGEELFEVAEIRSGEPRPLGVVGGILREVRRVDDHQIEPAPDQRGEEVGLQGFDSQVVGAGIGGGGAHRLGVDVDSCDARARTRRNQRQQAASTSDIEHRHPDRSALLDLGRQHPAREEQPRMEHARRDRQGQATPPVGALLPNATNRPRPIYTHQQRVRPPTRAGEPAHASGSGASIVSIGTGRCAFDELIAASPTRWATTTHHLPQSCSRRQYRTGTYGFRATYSGESSCDGFSDAPPGSRMPRRPLARAGVRSGLRSEPRAGTMRW